MNEPVFSALYGEILKKEGLEDYLPFASEFEELTKRLLAFNAHTNITAITDPVGIIERHYADCLKIAPLIKRRQAFLTWDAEGAFPPFLLPLQERIFQSPPLTAPPKS